MRRSLVSGCLALCLALAACDAGAPANDAAVDQAAPANETKVAAKAELPSCPFHKTGDWYGWVENGKLTVGGQVDVQMAGFKPTLTVRSSSPPTVAFDLALVQEPGAAVSDRIEYEKTGSPAYSKAEIWCGDEMIESFTINVV